jgi:hypothetical protein
MSEVPVRLPLWYLANTRPGGPDDVVGLAGGPGRKAAVLFSGKDRADRFVRSSRGFDTLSLGSQADLENFLAALGRKGFTHVVLDPASNSGAFVALADFGRAPAGPPLGPG